MNILSQNSRISSWYSKLFHLNVDLSHTVQQYRWGTLPPYVKWRKKMWNELNSLTKESSGFFFEHTDESVVSLNSRNIVAKRHCNLASCCVCYRPVFGSVSNTYRYTKRWNFTTWVSLSTVIRYWLSIILPTLATVYISVYFVWQPFTC
jgi:hypothetical protein